MCCCSVCCEALPVVFCVRQKLLLLNNTPQTVPQIVWGGRRCDLKPYTVLTCMMFLLLCCLGKTSDSSGRNVQNKVRRRTNPLCRQAVVPNPQRHNIAHSGWLVWECCHLSENPVSPCHNFKLNSVKLSLFCIQ